MKAISKVVSREAQDAFAVESCRNAAVAVRSGRFGREIAPIHVRRNIVEKEGRVTGTEELTLATDEGIRVDNIIDDLAPMPAWRVRSVVKEGRFVTPGAASELFDGASAQVLMDCAMTERGFRHAVVSMCVAGGMGAAGLFEIAQ